MSEKITTIVDVDQEAPNVDQMREQLDRCIELSKEEPRVLFDAFTAGWIVALNTYGLAVVDGPRIRAGFQEWIAVLPTMDPARAQETFAALIAQAKADSVHPPKRD